MAGRSVLHKPGHVYFVPGVDSEKQQQMRLHYASGDLLAGSMLLH